MNGNLFDIALVLAFGASMLFWKRNKDTLFAAFLPFLGVKVVVALAGYIAPLAPYSDVVSLALEKLFFVWFLYRLYPTRVAAAVCLLLCTYCISLTVTNIFAPERCFTSRHITVPTDVLIIILSVAYLLKRAATDTTFRLSANPFVWVTFLLFTVACVSAITQLILRFFQESIHHADRHIFPLINTVVSIILYITISAALYLPKPKKHRL